MNGWEGQVQQRERDQYADDHSIVRRGMTAVQTDGAVVYNIYPGP